MRHPIITLTTDWGTRDFFAGMVKGRLLSYVPDATLVDITHEIAPFDQNYAAFVVRHACTGFPEGTIHLIDVNAVESASEAFVVARSRGQYYVCTDNGMPAAALGDSCDKVVQVDLYQEGDFYTFAAYSLFCKVAKSLAEGADMETLGHALPGLSQLSQLAPIYDGSDRMTAHIAYIDAYGNAYLNVTYQEFERMRAGRPFRLWVSKIAGESVSVVVHSYDDDAGARHPRLLLTVSATGCLQIALRRESAARLFGLKVGQGVEIAFQSPQ